jgi:hypothetical protein
LPRCQGNPGKDQKQIQPPASTATPGKRGKPHLRLTLATAVLPYLPRPKLHSNTSLYTSLRLLSKFPTHMATNHPTTRPSKQLRRQTSHTSTKGLRT